MCKDIPIEEIDEIVKILHQKTLTRPGEVYAQKDWIQHFIKEERGYAVGYYENNTLLGVIIAEELLENGVVIWYVAFLPENQNKGYGKILLAHFEELIKQRGKYWMFLNATPNSVGFYSKTGFLTDDNSKVFEHYKEI